MIRINLLAAERERAKKKAVTFGTAGQKMAIGCSMILMLALLFIGWRYWVLGRESTQLDAEIDELVAYMLFGDEAPLREPVAGVSAFSKTFPQRGPRDKRGRSLRDFDLRTRLFRYPLPI